MVVSGAPVKENDHADRVCDMALDMVEAITDLKDRSTGTKRRKREFFFDTHSRSPQFCRNIFLYILSIF